MKMRKRWLALLLALVLCAGLPAAAYAYDYPAGTVVIPMNDSGFPAGSGGESEGWTFDGATLTLNAGHSFAVEGECSAVVVCSGTLLGGVFRGDVRVFGTLRGGVYHGDVIIGLSPSGRGTIEDAEFPLGFVLSGAAWADGVTAPETYHYSTGLTLPDASALTGGSGRFDGWYDSYDFAGEPLTEIPAGATGRRMLYARFVDGPATWPEAGALAQAGADYALDAAGSCTVYTARGLAWLANTVNAGDNFSNKTVTLANDINLLDGGVYGYGASTVIRRNFWVPINNFGGTFDGGGYSISNLYLSVSDRDAGLFGNSYGTIRDLEIASGRVSLQKLTKSGFCAGGVAYALGSTLPAPLASAGQTVTLYTVWQLDEITVTLSDPQQVCTVPNILVRLGSSYGALPALTKDGYTFNGWYNERGEKIESSTLVTNGAPHTLYARWTSNSGGGVVIPKAPEKVNGYDVSYKICPRDKTCPAYRFRDLDLKLWYHDGIHFCVENELMQGLPEELFDPNGITTRAQIVMILWRLEGQPYVERSAFADVTDGDWFAPALNWAAANEIVLGYADGRFGPNDTITREQFATILYRYARYRVLDTSEAENTDLLSYEDVQDVSPWAVPAMQWACGSGIINGVSECALWPKETATRAQTAAMIMRFLVGSGK